MAEANGLTILIDTQGAVDYHRQLRDLRNWIFAERAYVELHVATSPQGGLITGVLQEMKDDGVGLMTVGADNKIIELAKARNPALIISPDPTLKYGKCKNEVLESLEKFNNVNRKDGLRDMCELVERETEELALLGVRKNLLTMSAADIANMNWATQINALASPKAHSPGVLPMIEADLKDDLHSFTRGRNLVDHKVKGKRQEEKRQKQFADRMMQGPRLIAELVLLQRKFK
jgi:hypothetical protein